jgi:hypothetical protein
MLRVTIGGSEFTITDEASFRLAQWALEGAWRSARKPEPVVVRSGDTLEDRIERIIRRQGHPTTVHTIYQQLVAEGYKSTAADPVKVLRQVMSRSARFEAVTRGAWYLTSARQSYLENEEEGRDFDADLDEPNTAPETDSFDGDFENL